jgi:hypothetical protein
MDSSKQRHRLPGEHIYDNMVMGRITPPSVLDRIKDLELDQDIMVASYPKTGITK